MAKPSTLYQAQQAGSKTQTKTEGSFLSYEPSQVFREELIIKNLKPYNIAGINSEPQGTVIYQQSPPDLSATEPLFSLDGTGYPIVFRNESPDNLVVPSSYLAYNIYKSTNPVGNSGPLSNDSYIAKIGAQVLKSSLLETNAFYLKQSISSENSISFKITTPDVNDTFESKLSGTYFPASPIPGDYFLDGLNKRNTDTLGEAINLVAGRSTRLGGIFSGSLTRAITPSQIFLENTNEGQKSLMFANLSYNIYRPAYANSALGGIAGNLITTGLNNLLDNFGLQLPGAYYVGSSVSEPSFAESPINQTPIDNYGRDTQAIVLGPDVLGKDYEGNESSINFGLKSSAFINQGNLEGDLIWVSPKYKAGNSSFYSTNINFKPGSILDDTQRLIESADRLQGEARLKHVGNAINQVSRTFNDGYRNITKGSQVKQVTYKNGKAEVGTEYCRIFTKDSPYSTYNRLQKSDGIVNFGRKFTYSVLDSTFNLNIYPTKVVQNTPKPSWLGEGSVKKYMFSIENLAWKDSKKPGFNVQDLPPCEKGPNGGRIMWFAPYDLKFNDNSTANWQDTQFLGRPEPVYTYKSTSRNGTLSWKIVVDHPSVLNLIVDKILTNEIDSNADKVLESFFAGCQTYDLYDFAIRYNTVPLNDLQYIQQIISEATPEESLNILNSVTINATESDEPNPASTTTTKDVTTTPEPFPKDKFIGLGFYFNNDTPKPTEIDPSSYKNYYDSYYSEKQTFVTNTIDNKESVGQFFEEIIKNNYDKTISGLQDPGLILTIYDFFERKQIKEMTINIKGCASASASVDYNNKLATRRIKSVKKFLETYEISSGSTMISLKNLIGTKIKINDTVLGETATNVSPVGSSSFRNVESCTTNPVINGQTITGNKSIYLLPSMSCRSVFISDITTTPEDPITKQVTETIPAPAPPVVPPKQNPGPNKQPQVSEPITETVRTQGLSKKILRLLLSECNYFQAIEQTNPFLYRSLKEKLKYFEPSFHSTTPEGLNSRITFLNQCLRPGDTIPTIGTDGRPIYNDAINTAFGRPPVLVLRIGDFYNTKIIPRNIQFSYDPLILDMNREGIGVQPMIVGVNLSFDIIGGMGLARPVEDLQNALSFNYYANTEIYDERAVATEDVSKLDAIVEKGLLDKANEVAQPVVQNKIENAGGTPIGTILSTTNSGDYLVGRIKYKEVIKNLNQELETYFKLVPNTSEQVAKTSNFYVWQYATKNILYRTGKFANINDVKIFGKPKDLDKVFETEFSDVIRKIEVGYNPIVVQFIDTEMPPNVITQLKTKMIDYINQIVKPNFVTNVNQQLQPLNDQQQIVIDLIDKLNLVYNNNDGYIKSDGTAVPYELSGSSMIDIKSDLEGTASDVQEYMTVLFENKIAWDGDKTKPFLVDVGIDSDEISFFTIMCQTFTDKNKLQEFSDYVFPSNTIGGINYSNPRKPKKLLNDILGLDIADFFNLNFGKSYYDRYRNYKNKLEKIPTNLLGGPAIPRKYKTYGNFKLSSLTDDRKVDFTTNVPNAELIKKDLKDLYETVPTEGDKFNGKIF